MSSKKNKFPSARFTTSANTIGLNNTTVKLDLETPVEIVHIEANPEPEPEPEFLNDVPKHKKVKVGIQRLNVRSSPSLSARVLYAAKQDDIFEVTNFQQEWFAVKIDPSYGQSVGHLLATFVEEVDPDGE